MRPEYDGVLQIKDLMPNKSQYNPTLANRAYKPAYINTCPFIEFPDSVLPGIDGRVGTTQEMSGLVAFIFMESVTADAGWIRLWEAHYAAFFIVFLSRLDGRVDFTTTWLDGDFEGGAWANVFDLDMSNERLRDGILSILGGAKYVVPAGTKWGDEFGNFVAPPTENYFVHNEAKIVGQYVESSINHGEIKILSSNLEDKYIHVWDDNGIDLSGYYTVVIDL
jgi:hypothetical protein